MTPDEWLGMRVRAGVETDGVAYVTQMLFRECLGIYAFEVDVDRGEVVRWSGDLAPWCRLHRIQFLGCKATGNLTFVKG